MNRRRHKKKLTLWVIAVPLVLLVAYFAMNPDRWYMMTAGSGRQEVPVKKKQRNYGSIFPGIYVGE